MIPDCLVYEMDKVAPKLTRLSPGTYDCAPLHIASSRYKTEHCRGPSSEAWIDHAGAQTTHLRPLLAQLYEWEVWESSKESSIIISNPVSSNT